MRYAYIDSSFLLSIIFEDDNYKKSSNIWNTINFYMSSSLLDFECYINICKTAKEFIHQLPPKWRQSKLTKLDDLLEEINRQKIDRDILNIIKFNKDYELNEVGCKFRNNCFGLMLQIT